MENPTLKNLKFSVSLPDWLVRKLMIHAAELTVKRGSLVTRVDVIREVMLGYAEEKKL